MKKRLMAALLWAALLCALAAGCANTPEGPSGSESASPPALEFEKLTVEFVSAGSPEERMALAGRLPEKLRAALDQAGIAVKAVSVTLGASAAATAQAVAQGGVDVAFLPAGDYVAAGEGGTVVLADAQPLSPAEAPDDMLPGRTGQVYAGPSAYGRSLARRAAGGGALTWEELDRARWGVLDAASDLGNRYVSLWLADHYAGNDLADHYAGNDLGDLRQVTVYDSYEALLRAAALEEIDLFPCTGEAMADWAGAWTMDTTRSDPAGRRGFGREDALADEATAVGTLERCLTSLAVVREDETLTSPAFAQGLWQALVLLAEEDGDLAALTGCAGYAPLDTITLDPLRRLATMEETN